MTDFDASITVNVDAMTLRGSAIYYVSVYQNQSHEDQNADEGGHGEAEGIMQARS